MLYSEIMAFEGKTFDSINGDDLAALLENRVSERRTLDYKAGLPGRTDSATKEFLADASSFANSAGGYIIFGIEEREGVPLAIPGLGSVNADEEISRLEAKIRTGVEPGIIPAVRTKKVELADDCFVIALHVPQSWARPHMVTFKNTSRFYARTSNGKYQLKLDEMRDAFAFASSTSQRLRDFRLERLSDVVAQQTPVPLPEAATVLLHSVPLGAFSRTAGPYDLSSLEVHKAFPHVKPIYGSVHDTWHNFDGKVGVFSLQSGPRSYVQVYRNGILEAADTRILDFFGRGTREEAGEIPHVLLEKHVIVTVASMLRFQKNLGADPPVALMLSLARVSGYQIRQTGSGAYDSFGRPIDRDVLVIPEVLVESLEKINEPAVAGLLRPVFDMVWNATGHARSENYDAAGNWRHGYQT